MKKRDRIFVMLLYHIIVGCAQPNKRVTTKRISLKYRFRDVPYHNILTNDVIERLDKIDTSGERNREWFIMFINRCKMEYAFM